MKQLKHMPEVTVSQSVVLWSLECRFTSELQQYLTKLQLNKIFVALCNGRVHYRTQLHSCRTETARCFMLLNISLSHLRPLEMTPLSRACVSPY